MTKTSFPPIVKIGARGHQVKPAAAKAPPRPPGPSPSGLTEIVAHVPSDLGPGKMACEAIRPIPWEAISVGQFFVTTEAYGQYLIDHEPSLARQVYPAVFLATTLMSALLGDGRVLTRQQPLRVNHDVAMAAIRAADNPQGLEGIFAGAVRIISKEEFESWDPDAIPACPGGFANGARPSIAYFDSPMITCKANATMEFCGMPFIDGQTCDVREWTAVLGASRKTRHGEPVLVVLGELSERGQRFLQAVSAFAKRNPTWQPGDAAFPDYNAV